MITRVRLRDLRLEFPLQGRCRGFESLCAHRITPCQSAKCSRFPPGTLRWGGVWGGVEFSERESTRWVRGPSSPTRRTRSDPREFFFWADLVTPFPRPSISCEGCSRSLKAPRCNGISDSRLRRFSSPHPLRGVSEERRIERTETLRVRRFEEIRGDSERLRTRALITSRTRGDSGGVSRGVPLRGPLPLGGDSEEV